MKKERKIKIITALFLLVSSYCYSQTAIDAYTTVIKKQGQDPLAFVNQSLNKYDLIVFDDALHHAYEPFQFYIRLLQDKQFREKVKYIFIEVFSITTQPYIDKYLDSPVKDSTHLLKIFQDDFSGYGWRYQTYLDLLSVVWVINKVIPAEEKIKVVAVDQPIYWEALHTRQDYDLFQQSLVGRDYFMYKNIITTLKNFSDGRKGIFLTNTRHAYTGIKNAKGEYYWNTATFLKQFHPGKTLSVRFHNVSLFIEKKKEIAGKTTEGLDRVSYRWEKMENGLWDRAFAATGNKPVSIPLHGNIFGKAAYIGNHMLDVQQGQTMQDAYDALIFLAPLNALHFSAKLNFIYTETFKTELKRRILLLNDNDITGLLKREGVSTMEEFIEKISQYEPMSKNNYSNE